MSDYMDRAVEAHRQAGQLARQLAMSFHTDFDMDTLAAAVAEGNKAMEGKAAPDMVGDNAQPLLAWIGTLFVYAIAETRRSMKVDADKEAKPEN